MLLKHAVLFLLCMVTASHAAVVPLQTRLVFHAGEIEQRLLVANQTTGNPVILQSWIDNGQSGVLPEKLDYPFVVIPPVVKLASKELKNLRIITTAKINQLPKDRESLFFLNLYEVPGLKKLPDEAKEYQLKIGLNSQLKILYRPIADPSSLQEVVGQIDFRLSTGDKGEAQLVAINHSPYYLTPTEIKLQAAGKEAALRLPVDRDIPPFGQRIFAVEDSSAAQADKLQLVVSVEANKFVSFTKAVSH